MKKIRKIPPVCLLISLLRLPGGTLRFSRTYFDRQLIFDNSTFIPFRHVFIHPKKKESASCVFMVRFKFAHLSHRANKIASIIPMLLITGFPGFMQKMYSVDPSNGFWSGVYQWRSKEDLEAYKQSFVYRMMKRRAIGDSVAETTLPYVDLENFIETKTNK